MTRMIGCAYKECRKVFDADERDSIYCSDKCENADLSIEGGFRTISVREGTRKRLSILQNNLYVQMNRKPSFADIINASLITAKKDIPNLIETINNLQKE